MLVRTHGADSTQVDRRGTPGMASPELPLLTPRHEGTVVSQGPKGLPRLTIKQIRAWARAYRSATGRWPTPQSGPVALAPAPARPGWRSMVRWPADTAGCRG